MRLQFECLALGSAMTSGTLISPTCPLSPQTQVTRKSHAGAVLYTSVCMTLKDGKASTCNRLCRRKRQKYDFCCFAYATCYLSKLLAQFESHCSSQQAFHLVKISSPACCCVHDSCMPSVLACMLQSQRHNRVVVTLLDTAIVNPSVSILSTHQKQVPQQ